MTGMRAVYDRRPAENERALISKEIKVPYVMNTLVVVCIPPQYSDGADQRTTTRQQGLGRWGHYGEGSTSSKHCKDIVPISMLFKHGTTLRQLTNIIAQNVERTIDIYENVGISLPVLDESSLPNAALASNAELIQGVTLVRPAASQLLSIILPSALIITEAVTGFSLAGALGVIEASHIAEIIGEGSTGGCTSTRSGRRPTRILQR